MKKLDLEYYRQALGWLDPDTGAMLVKSAVACLLSENHRTGVLMATEVDGNPENYALSWQTKIDVAHRASLPNDQELTQKGAECISLILVKDQWGDDAFETARIGSGVDYWLMHSASFDFEARLEVSGIRKATPGNPISMRVKEKTKQAGKAPRDQYPTYISAIEFSGPQSSLVTRR